jgi:Ig-like domain from next to BRCA1 gene
MRVPGNRFLILVFLLLLPALACNMPRGTPTPSEADLIYTAAAETVAAQLTQVSQPPATAAMLTPGVQTGVPTFPAPPTLPPSATATVPLPSATATRVPASPTPIPCDRIKFVKDVTYPDNTEVLPGTKFDKIWRLQNDGSCTWTTAYALVFVGGVSMGAPAATALPRNVAPGDSVDISVTLTAPSDGGTYRSDFKLRNSSNVVFGLGDGNKPFWAQIKVPVATGLLFDFIAKASSAEWTSGIGSPPGSPLAFGGAVDDPNGTAKIVEGVKLETGSTSGKVLLNYPKRDIDGYVNGLYPAYLVQQGDRLKGKLGFLKNPDDNCGAGDVIFQISYSDGSTIHSIKEWNKTCTGKFLDVDLDLSGLKGQNVRFILTVRANGAATDDWAIWNSLRIEH